jgi:predicted nucleic-acid-binding Zn-ribbon protein
MTLEDTKLQGMVDATSEPVCPHCENADHTKMSVYDGGVLDDGILDNLNRTECYYKVSCKECGTRFFLIYRCWLVGVKVY